MPLIELVATPLLQMLNLCEAESISYLDEVASTTESLTLAKSVAFQVRMSNDVN